VIEQYNSYLEQNAVPAEDLIARYAELLKARPDDPESLHQRGHALLRLQRFDQAAADFSAASARRPLDSRLQADDMHRKGTGRVARSVQRRRSRSACPLASPFDLFPRPMVLWNLQGGFEK
jgi:hypothetical protein